MTDDTYRPEALAFLTRRGLGNAGFRQPLSLAALAVAIILVAGAAAFGLANASYARKHTVTGYLAPARGTVTLTAPRAGLIGEHLVAEGTIVTTGTPLLRLEAANRQTGNGVDTYAARRIEIHQQLDNIPSRQDFIRAQFQADRKRLEGQLLGPHRQQAQHREQARLQQENLQIAAEQSRAAQRLHAAGQISRIELLAANRASNTEAAALTATVAAISGLATEIRDRRIELGSLTARREDQLRQLDRETSRLRQALLDIQASATTLVVASRDGQVSFIGSAIGESVLAGQPLVRLVPGNAPLLARLLVPSRAAGFLTPGLPVRLMLDSFPHQQFGALTGSITHVSRTMLKPGDRHLPIAITEPGYLVDVDVTPSRTRLRLRPDMRLTADLRGKPQSALRWLLGPLDALAHRL